MGDMVHNLWHAVHEHILLHVSTPNSNITDPTLFLQTRYPYPELPQRIGRLVSSSWSCRPTCVIPERATRQREGILMLENGSSSLCHMAMACFDNFVMCGMGKLHSRDERKIEKQDEHVDT